MSLEMCPLTYEVSLSIQATLTRHNLIFGQSHRCGTENATRSAFLHEDHRPQIVPLPANIKARYGLRFKA